MIPSLEGWPTKVKEAPSSHEVRLTALDTNPVFQCLGDNGLDHVTVQFLSMLYYYVLSYSFIHTIAHIERDAILCSIFILQIK